MSDLLSVSPEIVHETKRFVLFFAPYVSVPVLTPVKRLVWLEVTKEVPPLTWTGVSWLAMVVTAVFPVSLVSPIAVP